MRYYRFLGCFYLMAITNMAAQTLAFDRPSGQAFQGRSMVVAQQGMVATSQPLAALAGLDVLKSGGNAADAAVAAGAVMGVVEPMSCGVGGDLFVIYWDAKTKKLYGLNASGRSPYALSRAVFARQGMTEIPDEGPLSWSVPGCVSGWSDLLTRFGSRPLAELLRPAIDYAEQGFAVSEIIAADWKSAEKSLARWPDSAKTFLIDGHAPAVGELFRNPRLAATYRAIAAGGIDAFYRGKIAEALVAFSQANGGFFSLRDFADHRNDWVAPISTNYRGYDVWELPPNGQGTAVLEMLNLLEGYDIASLGPGNSEYLHLFLEAKKLAYADRARFYADPDFGDLPLAGLISKPYAQRQRRRIDPTQAAKNVPHGDPRLAHGDTIYLTVVDKDRNCCSYIQSNYYGFGSQMVPGDLGFVLQNRGALFALDDEHLNRFEPHKRPFHTIIPALMEKGSLAIGFGIMGGLNQAQAHAQFVSDIADEGMNIQQALEAPRFTKMNFSGCDVEMEDRVPADVREQLTKMGHQIRLLGDFASDVGGGQAVMHDAATGVNYGASDPRKDGEAIPQPAPYLK